MNGMRICKQGWPFIVGCFIVGSMLLEAGQVLHHHELAWLAGVAFLAAVYCAYFFRDPARTIPEGNRWILSPADGKILEIAEARVESSGQPLRVIRIFLSIFDPHLQRSPLAGRVKSLHYKKGKFLDARDPQAAFENEQNRIELVSTASSLKTPVIVIQI